MLETDAPLVENFWLHHWLAACCYNYFEEVCNY